MLCNYLLLLLMNNLTSVSAYLLKSSSYVRKLCQKLDNPPPPQKKMMGNFICFQCCLSSPNIILDPLLLLSRYQSLLSSQCQWYCIYNQYHHYNQYNSQANYWHFHRYHFSDPDINSSQVREGHATAYSIHLFIIIIIVISFLKSEILTEG